jgi:hypothetical protein
MAIDRVVDEILASCVDKDHYLVWSARLEAEDDPRVHNIKSHAYPERSAHHFIRFDHVTRKSLLGGSSFYFRSQSHSIRCLPRNLAPEMQRAARILKPEHSKILLRVS